jgi:hypothetical protein
VGIILPGFDEGPSEGGGDLDQVVELQAGVGELIGAPLSQGQPFLRSVSEVVVVQCERGRRGRGGLPCEGLGLAGTLLASSLDWFRCRLDGLGSLLCSEGIGRFVDRLLFGLVGRGRR